MKHALFLLVALELGAIAMMSMPRKPAPAFYGSQIVEKHRGPEQEAAIAIPIASINGQDGLTWGDLASIVGLLSGILGGVQWIVMRAMIEPAIRRNGDDLKRWAELRFPTVDALHAHETADAIFQARVDRILERQ